MNKAGFLFLLLLMQWSLPYSLFAQASLLKDINPNGGWANIEYVSQVGELIYFKADDGEHGLELWRTDGTADGTFLVKDINPNIYSSDPSEFTVLNGELYFNANNGLQGFELWKTDGTTTGTSMVSDVNPDTLSAFPTLLTPVGDLLFFSAYTDTNGRELWKTDGTDAGTSMVMDIVPGVGDAFPVELTEMGGEVYFNAINTVYGQELWKSDGTTLGTQIVKDINPILGSSIPKRLTNGGDVLYFVADDGVHGEELWKTDGNTNNTVMMADIKPGLASSLPNELTFVDGVLYFAAEDLTDGQELWRVVDPATNTLEQLKDIHPQASSNPTQMTPRGDEVFFVAGNEMNGVELWITDGTIDGTTLVKDVYPGSWTSSLQLFGIVNDQLLFSATDGTNGQELWVSDGTEQGTTMIRDLNADMDSNEGNSFPSDAMLVGNEVFFRAYHNLKGWQIWKSDGSDAETYMLTAIPPFNDFYEPFPLGKIGENLLFAALDNSNGEELWIYEPNPVSFNNISIQSVDCSNETDGSIEIAVEGGIEPYTYLWSNGVTEPIIEDLEGGQYSLTVTDCGGATASIDLVVAAPEEITATFEIVDPTEGESNGSATVIPSGGLAPYSYSWSTIPEQTTETASNLPEGNYGVLITDANGCTATVTVMLGSVGIDAISAIDALSIFPNPTISSLFLDIELNTPKEIRLELYNTLGTQVFQYQEDLTKHLKKELNLDNYPKGVYFLTIQLDDKVLTKRILLAEK